MSKNFLPSGVFGFATDKFADLVPVFAEALAKSHGRGASFSLRVKGEHVVSLWGGNARDDLPWRANTSSVIFSSSKGLVSLLAGELVREGLLDLDAPVARYWPEFAANGKAEITVRELMSHHGGLSALEQSLTQADVLDWNRMVEVLAAARPIFDSKGPHQYHAVTFGWLVGEVLARVSGVRFAELFQQRIARPLQADAWFGVPIDQQAEVAELFGSPDDAPPPSFDDPHWDGIRRYERDAMTLGAAFPYGKIAPGIGFNDPVVRVAAIPGAGGIATADALSKIWSAASGPHEAIQLMDAATIEDMIVEQAAGDPAIHMEPPYPRWGTGFMLNSESREMLTEKSFGHDGYGGQVSFADPLHQVGFAFITNELQGVGDLRATNLIRTLKRVLGV